MIEIVILLMCEHSLTQSAREGMKRGGTSGLESFYITLRKA